MLFLKMFRDLKSNMVQFISIFLMTFLGIFIFTGMNAVGQGMNESSKRFYRNTNLADAFLYGMNFTEEEFHRLKSMEEIDNVERRLQLNATLDQDAKTTLQLNIVESNQISSNYLIDGEAFDPAMEGIWLDSSFAEANSVMLGDSISLMLQGKAITKIVKGLVMNPEYVYALKDENEIIPDHKNYGFAFLPAKGFMEREEIPYNQLLIKSNADKKRLKEIISEVFADKQVMLVMGEEQVSVQQFQNEVDQTKAMQAIFPMAFLLIAILTTLTTMTRITVNQRTQIGSLKALGFTNRKIVIHYVSYGTLVGTVSGTLGFVLGPTILPNLLFRFQKGFYTLPEWKGEMEPIAFFVVIACILCCGFSGYFASRKELKGVTAQILRPKAPKAGRLTRLERSKWWLNSTFDMQWNIRDLLRNKLRSVITVTGIIGSMTLIICAFGLRDTIKGITDTAYMEINTYNTKVSLPDTISQERLFKMKRNQDYQFIQEAAVEVNINEVNDNIMLTVVGEGNYLKLKNTDNHTVALPASGISLTNKLAKRFGLGVGDTLKWKFYGTNKWYTSEIAQIIRNPVNQGIFVSEKAYTSMDTIMLPTSFLTKEAADTFDQEDYSFVQSKEDLINTMDTMMKMMNEMIAILLLAAVILGAVVLYNLGVLSFHERFRELTTLRVLGFQYGKLGKLLQMQNIWLTLAGTLIGAPSGYLLLSYLLRFMGDNFDLLPRITIQSYGFSILGTLLLSMAVNLLLSRKLKTLDMISALKAVE